MLAVHKGGKPPLWAAVLDAAEAWGTPPWIVESQPGALTWIMRRGVLEKHRAARTETEAKHVRKT